MRWLGLVMLVFVSGCAKYEYEIVKPPELARHIGKNLDQLITRDSLEYRLITVDNRLVMRVYNQTDDSIELLGQKSFAVDPHGQSHPMVAQTIAPHSFIKLILPPQRTVVEQSGPTFGIGVGVSSGGAGRYGAVGYQDSLFDEPRYMVMYEGASYWEWDGETEVRLRLILQQGQQTLSHEFTLARKKM